MKILIAGLGSIGRRHLKNLIALGETDIVLFRTGKGTVNDDFVQEYPVEHNLEKAMEEKPDAVVISNPTAMHMDVAVLAAQANATIFLEKPISHTFDSLIPFERALAASTSKVYVAYQFRFNDGLKKIKDLIQNEEMGRPISFQSRWGEYLPDWHPWEDYRLSYAASSEMGGGVVLTLSHPIDYLRWIFGEVTELFAVTGNQSNLELTCEDFADVSLKYANGVTGDIHLDYYSKPKQHDLVIQCERGTISWDYKSNIVKVEDLKSHCNNILPAVGHKRNQMYLEEIAHFIDVCKNDIEPVCTYKDGKQALNLALGILQSGRYQDRVIFED